jgi:hypothetical protein
MLPSIARNVGVRRRCERAFVGGVRGGLIRCRPDAVRVKMGVERPFSSLQSWMPGPKGAAPTGWAPAKLVATLWEPTLWVLLLGGFDFPGLADGIATAF